MKQEVNARKFEKNDPEFVEFFNEHGWVVLKGNLTSDVIQGGLGQWANLKQRYAHEMGLSLVEYENEVSQWRNLWHNEKGYFRDLIYTPVLHEWRGRAWDGRALDFFTTTLFASPTKDTTTRSPGIRTPCSGQ